MLAVGTVVAVLVLLTGTGAGHWFGPLKSARHHRWFSTGYCFFSFRRDNHILYYRNKPQFHLELNPSHNPDSQLFAV